MGGSIGGSTLPLLPETITLSKEIYSEPALFFMLIRITNELPAAIAAVTVSLVKSSIKVFEALPLPCQFSTVTNAPPSIA